MKARLWWLALVAAVLLNAGTAWADSEFYVIAGGGGVGTRITTLPYTISSPGFYYLGGNLSTTGTSANVGIIVNADNVTLDLMGFSLTHTGSVGSSCGIYMSGRANVEIRNGTVSGFANGIVEDSSSAGANHRVANFRAINNTNGIWLYGKNHLVKNCTCSSNNNLGISVGSGTIIDSIACDNYYLGIRLQEAGSVIGNIANNTNSSGTFGFILGTGNLVVDRNSANGNGTNYSGGPTNPAYWGINAGR